MRKLFEFTLLLLCITALTKRLVAETLFIVRMSDHIGNESVQLMTAEKLNPEREGIKREQQVFQKALTRASQAWQEDPEKKNIMFPRSELHPRRIEIVRWFTDPLRAGTELENQKKVEKQERKREKENGDNGIVQEAVQVLKSAIKQELKALEKEEREKKRAEVNNTAEGVKKKKKKTEEQ